MYYDDLQRMCRYGLDMCYNANQTFPMARSSKASWEDRVILETNMAIRCGKPHRAIWQDVAAHTGMSISQIILRTSLEFIRLAKQGKIDAPLANYIYYAFGGRK